MISATSRNINWKNCDFRHFEIKQTNSFKNDVLLTFLRIFFQKLYKHFFLISIYSAVLFFLKCIMSIHFRWCEDKMWILDESKKISQNLSIQRINIGVCFFCIFMEYIWKENHDTICIVVNNYDPKTKFEVQSYAFLKENKLSF